MSNKVNFGGSVSLREAARIIKTVGESITVLILGEPGIGKTQMLHTIAEETKKRPKYIDCGTLDVPDLFMRVPDRDSKALLQYTNDNLNDNEPMVIMFDEIGKLPGMIFPIVTKCFLERTLGDKPLPKGTIVFATSNNTSDGLGDRLQAHVGNRLMILRVRKPNVTEWCQWAAKNGIDAFLRTFAVKNPDLFASYTEISETELNANPYIFNPAKKALSFVSPRSLAKCDPVIRNRKVIGDVASDGMASPAELALAGMVGVVAATKMIAFDKLIGDVHEFDAIIADPEHISVPIDRPCALWFMVNKSIEMVKTQDELSAFTKYVQRFPNSEYRHLFFCMIAQSPKTAGIAKNNGAYRDWAKDNYDLTI